MATDKYCESCRETERVLSIAIAISYSGVKTHVPTMHICESCLLVAGDLAKIAYEIQGGTPTLAEHFAAKEFGAPKPRRVRALFLLADSMKAQYCRWRGVRS